MGQLPAREWGGKGGGSLTTPSELGGPVLAWGHQGCPASISPGGGGRGARCPQQGVVPPPWAVGTGRSDFQRKSRGPGHQQVSSLGVGGAGRGARTPHPDHTPGCGTLQRPALHLAGTTLLWRQHAVVGWGADLGVVLSRVVGAAAQRTSEGVSCATCCVRRKGRRSRIPAPQHPAHLPRSRRGSQACRRGLPGVGRAGHGGSRPSLLRRASPSALPSRIHVLHRARAALNQKAWKRS